MLCAFAGKGCVHASSPSLQHCGVFAGAPLHSRFILPRLLPCLASGVALKFAVCLCSWQLRSSPFSHSAASHADLSNIIGEFKLSLLLVTWACYSHGLCWVACFCRGLCWVTCFCHAGRISSPFSSWLIPFLIVTVLLSALDGVWVACGACLVVLPALPSVYTCRAVHLALEGFACCVGSLTMGTDDQDDRCVKYLDFVVHSIAYRLKTICKSPLCFVFIYIWHNFTGIGVYKKKWIIPLKIKPAKRVSDCSFNNDLKCVSCWKQSNGGTQSKRNAHRKCSICSHNAVDSH